MGEVIYHKSESILHLELIDEREKSNSPIQNNIGFLESAVGMGRNSGAIDDIPRRWEKI